MIRRCVDCLAYEPYGPHEKQLYDGKCRLNPPQYVGDDKEENAWFYFPEIDYDDWCLQFVPKEKV